MNINKKYKLEKIACKKSDDRAELEHIVLERKKNQCTAMSTNGHAIAIVQCEMKEDEPVGKITIDALKHARKVCVDSCMAWMHLTDKTAITADGSEFTRSVESSAKEDSSGQLSLFRANCESKIKDKIIEIVPSASSSQFVLTLNPTLLKNLADAMGCDDIIRLRFEMNDDGIVEKCIRCEDPMNENEVVGAIMPCFSVKQK